MNSMLASSKPSLAFLRSRGVRRVTILGSSLWLSTRSCPQINKNSITVRHAKPHSGFLRSYRSRRLTALAIARSINRTSLFRDILGGAKTQPDNRHIGELTNRWLASKAPSGCRLLGDSRLSGTPSGTEMTVERVADAEGVCAKAVFAARMAEKRLPIKLSRNPFER